jgi:threonine synthase
MAQICYYFEAASQLTKEQRENLVVSVPSGNFGNLTAGLLAKALGLPVKRFIAATNENDTVPRYLETGEWDPKPTVATTSNAMDVSQPNNWPRIEELCQLKGWGLDTLGKGKVSDEQSAESVRDLKAQGYLCEPHGAIAYRLLDEQLQDGETGLFLCTAHPAKFKEVVDDILGSNIDLPGPLAKHAAMELLSEDLANDFDALKEVLRRVQP